MEEDKKQQQKEPVQAERRFLVERMIPRWLSLPFLAIILFFGYMLIGGEYSYKKSVSYELEIKDLKAKIKENIDSASLYQHKAEELNTDRETLEKVAREKYGMKREKEDVYIMEDE